MNHITTLLIVGLTFFSSAQNTWQDSLDLARDAYKAKKYEEAYKHYDAIKNDVPKNVDLRKEFAQSAYRAGKYDEANEIYSELSKENQSNQEIADNWYNSGNSQMKKQDYKNAVNSYKNALRINPNDEEARYNLSEAMRNQKKQEQQQKSNPQDSQSDENNDENKNPQDENEKEDEGKLQENSVEKILDKLMKDEAKTKQELTDKHKSTTGSSGKDW